MTEFASTLYYLKKKKGLTFRELADALGIEAGYFCSVIRGECSPSEEFFQKVVTFFELNEEEQQYLQHCVDVTINPISVGEELSGGSR